MKQLVLQGFLYDDKSSFSKGSAKAPPLIRRAYHSDSSNYYAEDGQEVHPGCFKDAGDYSITDYFDIEQHTHVNLEAKLPLISLGGDHSITYPILRAFHRHYGKVDILHIDAHADLYHEFQGDPYSHACPFARIMEEGLAGQLTQVGVRTLNGHQEEQAARFGVTILPMKSWQPGKLPAFKNPTYLSLDLDALDPAFAPGVSHHEPGGFNTREVLGIIRQLQAPLIGADIVEYNPDRDINGVTAMVAAKLLKEIAAQMLGS